MNRNALFPHFQALELHRSRPGALAAARAAAQREREQDDGHHGARPHRTRLPTTANSSVCTCIPAGTTPPRPPGCAARRPRAATWVDP